MRCKLKKNRHTYFEGFVWWVCQLHVHFYMIFSISNIFRAEGVCGAQDQSGRPQPRTLRGQSPEDLRELPGAVQEGVLRQRLFPPPLAGLYGAGGSPGTVRRGLFLLTIFLGIILRNIKKGQFNFSPKYSLL